MATDPSRIILQSPEGHHRVEIAYDESKHRTTASYFGYGPDDSYTTDAVMDLSGGESLRSIQDQWNNASKEARDTFIFSANDKSNGYLEDFIASQAAMAADPSSAASRPSAFAALPRVAAPPTTMEMASVPATPKTPASSPTLQTAGKRDDPPPKTDAPQAKAAATQSPRPPASAPLHDLRQALQHAHTPDAVVRDTQKMLHVTVDGEFGAKTQAALKDYLAKSPDDAKARQLSHALGNDITHGHDNARLIKALKEQKDLLSHGYRDPPRAGMKTDPVSPMAPSHHAGATEEQSRLPPGVYGMTDLHVKNAHQRASLGTGTLHVTFTAVPGQQVVFTVGNGKPGGDFYQGDVTGYLHTLDRLGFSKEDTVGSLGPGKLDVANRIRQAKTNHLLDAAPIDTKDPKASTITRVAQSTNGGPVWAKIPAPGDFR